MTKIFYSTNIFFVCVMKGVVRRHKIVVFGGYLRMPMSIVQKCSHPSAEAQLIFVISKKKIYGIRTPNSYIDAQLETLSKSVN